MRVYALQGTYKPCITSCVPFHRDCWCTSSNLSSLLPTTATLKGHGFLQHRVSFAQVTADCFYHMLGRVGAFCSCEVLKKHNSLCRAESRLTARRRLELSLGLGARSMEFSDTEHNKENTACLPKLVVRARSSVQRTSKQDDPALFRALSLFATCECKKVSSSCVT